jgi:predicted CXXCH cytochrome family protein
MKRFVCFLAGISIVIIFYSIGILNKAPLSQALKDGFGPSLAVAKTEGASVYDMDIKPLSTEECARCHFSVFRAIKQEGGKHKIECVRCHREYHVFSPRKQNYDQIMPNCAWCHKSATGGAFHGEDKALAPCLVCHADPHQPLAIPSEEIEEVCGPCHAPVVKEVADFPSKHQTDVACGDCHTGEHGFIPECSICHESHSPAVEMASKDCMVCHPVHKPLEIAYAKTTDSVICAGCHDDVYDMLQKKVTKHTAVGCADCHPSHGEALWATASCGHESYKLW